MKAYDLIVIGAGPGGYVGAVEAARLGKSAAVIEARQAGGTCLNRGCIPTKTLLHSCELIRQLRENSRLFGIKAQDVAPDYEGLRVRRDEVVGRLRGGVEQLLKANKVDLYNGKAKIIDGNTVELSGCEVLKCENMLIASGSVPSVPPVEGAQLPGVFTSDGLLEGKLSELSSVVIIGGGVIGVECADIFSALGTSVTLIEAMDRIIPMAELEISRSLSALMKKRGVNIFTGAQVRKIEKSPKGLEVSFEQKGKELSAQAHGVLIATGRRAYTEGLFADGFTLEMNRGQIVTNECFQTSEPNIYAVGDVIFGSCQLAHAASAQAVNAVNSMYGQPPPMDLNTVPSCIYTQPEIAFAGLSQQQAKERGIAVVTGKATTLSNGKSVIVNAERGFVKVVFDAQSGALLGASLMCERATDMIGGLAAAISAGLTQKELSGAIYPHPTFSEAIGEAFAGAKL